MNHEPYRPPLDPPPFEPVHVRRCIRTNVRIQNHDNREEVLILTSLTSAVDTFLNAHNEDVNAQNEDMDDGNVDDDEDDDSDDGSDISESSSSSSYDEMGEQEKEEGDSGSDRSGNNQVVNRMRAYWPRGDPICVVCRSTHLAEFHPFAILTIFCICYE